MSEKYHVSSDIKILIQKDETNEYHILEEKIKNREMIPKIIVWDDIVIDNIYIYELCIKNDIEFRLYKMDFPSIYHAYSWICSEQLERKDLNNTMRRFLLGYMALSESAIHRNTINRKIKDIPAIRDAVDIVAKCYGLSSVCIFNYKRLTESVLKINEVSPTMANFLLCERIRITAQQIIGLGNKSSSEIMMLTKEVTRLPDSILKYTDLSKKVIQDKKLNSRRRGRPSNETVPEIRKMPEYDPDAELNSLSLTLPSWINTINRIQNSYIGDSSINARNKLHLGLFQLSESADLLRRHLEESVNEE